MMYYYIGQKICDETPILEEVPRQIQTILSRPIYLRTDLSQKGKNKLLPIYEKPHWIINSEIKKLWSEIDEDLSFNACIISLKSKESPFIYWACELPTLNCIDETSEWEMNGLIKKLVLNRQKIGEQSIFRVQNKLQNYWVIRLDVLEAMLLARIHAFRYTQIETR